MAAIIVIPTYNEEKSLEALIKKIFAQMPADLSVMVVDDNSPDGTGKKADFLAQYYSLSVIHRPRKEGIGRAYVEAFKKVLSLPERPEFILQMDADLSHDPEIIPDFVKNLENGVQYICGTRYRKGGGIPDEWGLHRKFLSYFGNLFVRVLYFKSGLSDFTSRYKFFTL